MVKKKENILSDITGKTIAGIVCHRYYQLNDILIILDVEDHCKVVTLSTIHGEVKLHTIENQEIIKVQITNNARMFLFHTTNRTYLVNDQNQIVEDSSQWHDAYFDALANTFYRKDKQDHWYDIEGFRMHEKTFLIDDVLTSLDTKKSKQSLSFKNQEIFISPHKQLIQVGKLVLDLHLNIVKYFGERITGLGQINIAFEGKDILQEVRLGLDHVAFVNEYSHEPFLFEDTKITNHLGTYIYGKKRVVIFQAEEKTYGVEGSSDNFITYKERPLQIILDKHVSFNHSELIKVSDGKKYFYYDINRNEPFDLTGLDYKNLSDIDAAYIRVGNSKVFNVSNSNDDFAILEHDGSIFTLDEGTIRPQRIEDPKDLSKYYGFATVDGQQKLFSKKDSKILKFGDDALEVSKFAYNTPDKLINAIDTNGNKLVLDLRLGFDNIAMAKSNGDKIAEFNGDIMPIGNKVLRNVLVEKLGSNVRRVIDINEISLPYFTLPSELKQSSEQDIPSVFAGNVISEIHYTQEVEIEERIFIRADFSSFSGEEHSIILEKKTGAPLHLQGVGHRNELATTWVDYTIRNSIYLGDNRIVGVKTIRENQKENELLFSVQQLTSWISFYNDYLPIFKHVIEVKNYVNRTWDYHLFELAEVSKDKEYVVVEKVAPYRILADKKSDEYRPRIVSSKLKSIKSPMDLSKLERLFYLDSSILVEVE